MQRHTFYFHMPCSMISTMITKWKLIGCMVTQIPSHKPQLFIDHALHDLVHELHKDWCQPLFAIYKAKKVKFTKAHVHRSRDDWKKVM